MIGTFYVRVQRTYVVELPNPCGCDDFETAMNYIRLQRHDPSTRTTIRADEDHIYIESLLSQDTEAPKEERRG